MKFKPADFIPQLSEVLLICKLGLNSFVFQTSNLLVQITLNNTLRIYGGNSIYGADIPIAVAGIVSKIQVIFTALIIGMINGAQPICSYNYGAAKYKRVRQTMKLLVTAELTVSTVVWIIFEVFPKPIISLFGDAGGNALYFEYATRFMRGYFSLTFISVLQPCASTFFTAIGKAAKGAILSFSRSVVFLIPLLLLLPYFLGINGVMFAQPISDLLSALLAVGFLIDEFKKMPKENLA